MSLEVFLEKFDQFADTPGMVTKMRELVLQLAVTGNLVQQSVDDQPAECILDAAKKARESMIEEGQIRRTKALAPMTIDDAPFKCPAGWVWARFGEISYSFRGHNPPKSVFKDDPADGYVRFIQQRDFRTDKFAVYVPESRHLKLVKKGEIVMAAYGNIGNTCRTVEGAFNVAIAKVMEIPPVERDYIELLIRSNFIKGALEKVSSRVAVPSMSSEHMRSLPVPVPPLDEQKRIVAKVQELMTFCDQLEAQWQERESLHTALARASLARFTAEPTSANLEFLFHKSYDITPAGLRNSILTLAVQGKLVPQDSDDEPAEQLLVRLVRQQRKGFKQENIRSRKPVPRVTRSEWPFEIPESWELPCFDDVSIIVSGVTKGRKLAGRETITLPYLRVANVQRGYLVLDVMKEIEVLVDDREKYRLERGDVLMTEGGDWDKLGRAAIWNEEIESCIHQNHVYRVRSASKKELLPSWIALYANSPAGRSFFENASKQTTNLASINMTQLRACPLPLPPAGEQRRIVAKVEQLLGAVDELEILLTEFRAISNDVFDALIAEISSEGGSIDKVSA